MGELQKALGDIGSIRRQVAGSTQFRGYGPATLAATGLMAVVASAAQAFWVAEPATHFGAYLGAWVGTAVLGVAVAGTQMYRRSRRIHSGLSDEMIRMAVEQFLPAVGAGVLLTVALVRFAPAELWMLPGLWQVIFGLGVFSSCRFLPRAMRWAGAWYLLLGLVAISLGGDRALAPWVMAVGFGVGQFLVAGVLWMAAKEDSDEV